VCGIRITNKPKRPSQASEIITIFLFLHFHLVSCGYPTPRHNSPNASKHTPFTQRLTTSLTTTPLLILRHALRRRPRRPLSAIPAHHNRATLTLTMTHLLLHIRAILDILPKVANMASDLFIWFERKGDHGDEAESKPLPALHHATAEVAAVLALHGDVFGAFEGRGECCSFIVLGGWVLWWRLGGRTVSSAGEEEEHFCGL
jgi:hypothetical protein